MARKSEYVCSLAAALVAICAVSAVLAVPVITRTETTPFYSPQLIMMAKQDGGLPAQIYGSPFPGVRPAAAIAPLRLPASVGGGNIVPMERGRRTQIRLVLMFNSENVSPEQACEAAATIATQPADRGLNVNAVLCRGNNFVSHAHLRDEAVQSAKDSRYGKVMEQLLLALMPPEEQRDDDID